MIPPASLSLPLFAFLNGIADFKRWFEFGGFLITYLRLGLGSSVSMSWRRSGFSGSVKDVVDGCFDSSGSC